MVNNLFRQII